jgi:hypothetical protein
VKVTPSLPVIRISSPDSLQSGRGTNLLPVATPIIYVPVKTLGGGWGLSAGDVLNDWP